MFYTRINLWITDIELILALGTHSPIFCTSGHYDYDNVDDDDDDVTGENYGDDENDDDDDQIMKMNTKPNSG